MKPSLPIPVLSSSSRGSLRRVVGSALVAVALSLFVAGCASTPAARISKNQAAFDSYPVVVQDKIRAGDVDIGFTAEQVRMALGAPDSVHTITSQEGQRDIWIYADKRSRVSFGFGFGTGGGGTRVGTGVGVSSGGGYGERLRVILVAGKVTAVETVN